MKTMPGLTIVTGKCGLLERWWHRRLGMPLPFGIGRSGPKSAVLVRLLPYRWRRVHHLYASSHGFFWLKCQLCDRPFGGHESGGVIPNPMKGDGCGFTICSRCTLDRTRKGLPV